MTTLGCLRLISALSGAVVAIFVHAAVSTGAKGE
jgi:hypothetical protein